MKRLRHPPVNWQDFEDLCFNLWREIWCDGFTTKHGRTGQAQAGVDIYGKQRGENYYTGIQCKGKENYENQAVDEDTIREEVVKTDLFEPTLGRFIIATTDKRDVKIQKIARIESEIRKEEGKCPICIKFWSDINDELDHHERIHRMFYDPSQDNYEWKRIGVGEYQAIIKLKSLDEYINKLFNIDTYAHFNFGESLNSLFRDIVTELALNADNHGGATEVELNSTESYVSFIDNGGCFDAVKALKDPHIKKGGGLTSLKGLLECYPDIKVKYERLSRKNIYKFIFNTDLKLIKGTMETIKVNKFFNNRGTQIKPIPNDCKEVMVLLDNDIMVSGIHHIIDNLLRETKPNILIKLMFDDSRGYYIDMVKELYSSELKKGRIVILN